MLKNLAVTYYGLAAGADMSFFTNIKTNSMIMFSSIAIVVTGFYIAKHFLKKSWAELVGYLIPAAIALYLINNIDQLKNLGDWLMSFGR